VGSGANRIPLIYRQYNVICPIRADRGHSGVFQQLSFAWLEENVYKRDS
jgi:hypothetical protein